MHLNRFLQVDVRLWTVAPFQTSRGVCEWFDRHKNALVNCPSFPTAAEHTSVLSVPTGKILLGWARTNVWAVPRKLIVSQHILIWTVLLLFGLGNSLLNFVQAYILYVYIYMYIHTNIRTYIHTNAYIHTHTHAGISYTRVVPKVMSNFFCTRTGNSRRRSVRW